MADTNALPLYIRFTSLPNNFQGTPQELADAIAEGLEILAAQQFALFQRGASEPSSDIGPWMDTSSTVGMWKAFDYITGRYVPMALDPLSLRYILSADTPDNTKYDVWFKLNGSGKATAVEIYYDGAWHDVYEDQFAAVTAGIPSLADYAKTTDVNAAIAAAIDGISTGGGLTADRTAFTAIKTGDQLFAAVALGGNFQVTWDATDYDTGSAFSANQYLAKAHGVYEFEVTLAMELTSGTFNDTGYYIGFRVNGGIHGGLAIYNNGPGLNDGNQRTYHHTIQCVLNVGDKVDVYVTALNDTTAQGRVINNGSNRFSGYMIQQLS